MFLTHTVLIDLGPFRMDIIRTLPSAEDCPVFFTVISRWFSVFEKDGMPKIDDLNGEDALRDYRIIAVIEGARVRYIDVGDRLEKLYGSSLKGKYADEAYRGWFKKIVMQEYDLVRDEKFPAYKCLEISTIIKKIGYQKLVLPTGENDAVTGFIVYILPTDPDIQEAKDWRALVEKTPWL